MWVEAGVGMFANEVGARSGMTWTNGTLSRLLAAKRKQTCYAKSLPFLR
jgi:hypothetical protein